MTRLYDYYDWSPYWASGFYLGGYGYLGEAIPQVDDPDQKKIVAAERAKDDVHLRSSGAVTGYDIHATDGNIGHIQDFLIEDADWSIHYLVVDTKNWWPGKRVLISPRSVHEIDWFNHIINVDVDRQKIQGSPTYDPSILVDRAYERLFHTYYDGDASGPALRAPR